MKYLLKIGKPIYKNLLFFVFMYILGTICIIVTTERAYAPFYYKLFFELFFDIYAICILLSILPNRLRHIASWVSAGLLYLLAIVDLFCFIRINSTFSPGVLQLIKETNSQEATEFISSYISLDILISPISIVLLLLFIHILTCRYCNREFNIRSNFTSGIITCLVIIGLICGLKNKKFIIQTWQHHTLGQVEQFFANNYYARRAQYLPIHRFLFAIHANRLTKHEITTLQHVMEETKIDSCLYTSPNIILIIGESYNKHHSQLYGYPYCTTPNQLHRYQNNELYVFSDAVTPFNLTSEVLKNAFSLNDITKNEPWCTKPMFTNIFKKCNYHIAFFSNQFVINQQKNMADFSGGMFLNDSILSKYQFDIRNQSTHRYDEELLLDYQMHNKRSHRYQLTIFSLIGQHTNYTDRFPSSFAKFHPKDYKRKDLSKEQLKIVSDYDNSILYNDYVVEKIIQEFEQEESIVIYMADHGDECYDQIKIFGRQHCDPVTKEVATNEYQIPFWIWCSNKYHNSHPNIIQQIQNSIHRRFYSDDLSHLLIYLGGISNQYYLDEYNILSPSYNNNRKRLLKKNTDYDMLIKQ